MGAVRAGYTGYFCAEDRQHLGHWLLERLSNCGAVSSESSAKSPPVQHPPHTPIPPPNSQINVYDVSLPRRRLLRHPLRPHYLPAAHTTNHARCHPPHPPQSAGCGWFRRFHSYQVLLFPTRGPVLTLQQTLALILLFSRWFTPSWTLPSRWSGRTPPTTLGECG